tara:strand:+ start:2101 stop:2346 length:246 start_codon:yes stop_codon:yes gene_type:complete
MGNCLFGELSKPNPNISYEKSPLLPNIVTMQKICKKEICALCEKKSTSLKIIDNVGINSISTIVFCQDCRFKLGYDTLNTL